MKSLKEIQQSILDSTGIKTSVKKLTGSMKDYIRFSAMFQGGDYPKFSFEFRNEFKNSLGGGNFASDYSFDIKQIYIDESEQLTFKKERKPKTIDETKVKSWGSKNSQLRLDKAASRHAKRAINGNTVRYW